MQYFMSKEILLPPNAILAVPSSFHTTATAALAVSDVYPLAFDMASVTELLV
jgi:hypothetical protein